MNDRQRGRIGQHQEAGDNAAVVQAGRDASITIGIDAVQAIDIAERVVRRELEHYQDRARDLALLRVEEIRGEFVERISALDRSKLDAFADPDVQEILTEAQKGYVRSGRQDVKRALVDLVAARCSVESGSLEANIIADAVQVVRKLSKQGIAALTVAWLTTRTKNDNIVDLEMFESWAQCHLGPFIDSMPLINAEIDYLVSSGCATLGPIQIDLGESLQRTYPGLFQRGVGREQISHDLDAVDQARPQKIFLPLPSVEGPRWQAAVLNEAAARQQLAAESEEMVEEYVRLLNEGALTPDECTAAARAASHEWNRLLEVRDKTQLNQVRVTAVGTAIAHCNWTSTVGEEVPLAMWLTN